MVILSGRGEAVRRETEQWLKTHGVEFDLLLMRPQGDNQPDDKLKKSWLDTVLKRDDVFCVFDDRQKVVNMWRREGLLCFQVAEGAF
jgi:hypothetical protein